MLFRSADIGKAAGSAIYSCFNNSGQECSALTRLLVPESKRDEVIDVISSKMTRYTVGDPLDESMRCGPMVSRRQQESVTAHIASGIAEGATLVAGGEGMPDGLDSGYYVKPTVFAEVTPDMTIFREEVFGPVSTVMRVDTEDEAFALANDTEFGLSASVFTNDMWKIDRAVHELQAGLIKANGPTTGSEIHAPFGGEKNSSGHAAREQGDTAQEFFTRTRTAYVKPGRPR